MPRIPAMDHLPREGTLWFFADIEEQVDWAAQSGPATLDSAVLFHPGSVKGVRPAALPTDLPETHHCLDTMTQSKYRFFGPSISVYPRWPITGHEAKAWGYYGDQHKIEGVTDWSYHDVQSDRAAQLKDAIVGNKVKIDASTNLISRSTHEQRSNSDGRTWNVERRVYEPDKWGNKFPYNACLGHHVLRWMQDHCLKEYGSAQRRMDNDLEQGRNSAEKDIETVHYYRQHLASLAHLFDDLSTSDLPSKLSDEQQQQMDTLMQKVGFDRQQGGQVDYQMVRPALIDLVAEAMHDLTLLDGIPEELLALVEDTTLPSHDNTEHFLLGPKQCYVNPTSGHGVRLA